MAWPERDTITEREDAASDKPRRAAALRRLVALGLLEEETAGALRLHRLLAVFVRQVAMDPAAQVAVEATVLNRAGELNAVGYAAPLLPLQRHLRAVTAAARGRADEPAAALCNQLGYHLRLAGDLTGAQPYLEQAPAICRRVLGENHPTTVIIRGNLRAIT